MGITTNNPDPACPILKNMDLNIEGDLTFESTSKAYFRDSALYIYSSTDGQLDIIADTTAKVTGGAVTLLAGAGSNTSITITAAASNNAAGTMIITSGRGGTSQAGGVCTITAGQGGSTTGNGGAMAIVGGAAAAGNSTGGATSATGGAGQGSGTGGAVNLAGGQAGATGAGGAITITSGAGGATSGAAGAVTIAGGSCTDAAGAAITLNGGDAATGNQNGGDINLHPGAASGSGIAGAVIVNSSHDLQVAQCKLKLNGNFVLECTPVTIVIAGAAAATAANYDTFYIAKYKCTLINADEVHTTAGTDAGAVSLQIERRQGTEIKGAGDALLTNNANAGFNLKGTAETVQNGTLVDLATRTLEIGDRLGLGEGGVLTSVAHVTVTCWIQASP